MIPTFDWLTPLLVSAETGMNRYMQLDPAWQDWLKPLVGKSLGIRVRHLPIAITFYFQDKVLRLSKGIDETDAQITASPTTFLALAYVKAHQNFLSDGRLQLQGDLALVQAFETLWQQLQPAWAEVVSPYLGDPLTHYISEGVRATKQASQRGCTHLSQQLTEYIQDELQLLPAKPQLVDFYQRVDILRQDTDRLAANISRFNTLVAKEAQDE